VYHSVSIINRHIYSGFFYTVCCLESINFAPAAKNCILIPQNTVNSMTSLVLTSKTCTFCLWILFMAVICLAKEKKVVISLSIVTIDLFNGETRRTLSSKLSKFCIRYLNLRLLMSYIYGAPILDVSISHTTTQHSR
jgi:hypothetical protein